MGPFAKNFAATIHALLWKGMQKRPREPWKVETSSVMLFSRRGVKPIGHCRWADDLEGLRLIRDRAPERMDIAAGEHGYNVLYFRRMLEADAVDVLQADATRCGACSGFLQAGAFMRRALHSPRRTRRRLSTCTFVAPCPRRFIWSISTIMCESRISFSMEWCSRQTRS